MHRLGIHGEGELRGQLANPGSPGKMAIKTVCVWVLSYEHPVGQHRSITYAAEPPAPKPFRH